jgi:hypothetical protein
MPEEEFYDLMTKYDLKENGTFSYVEFLRHFILSLKPKEESNLMTRQLIWGLYPRKVWRYQRGYQKS